MVQRCVYLIMDPQKVNKKINKELFDMYMFGEYIQYVYTNYNPCRPWNTGVYSGSARRVEYAFKGLFARLVENLKLGGRSRQF